MAELVAFGVFVVMVVNGYLVWFFQRKITGNGNALMVAFLILALVLLAGNIALTVQSRNDINRELVQGCTARKVVADVQTDIQKEAKATNKLFLIKGFPGFTHEQLLELI